MKRTSTKKRNCLVPEKNGIRSAYLRTQGKVNLFRSILFLTGLLFSLTIHARHVDSEKLKEKKEQQKLIAKAEKLYKETASSFAFIKNKGQLPEEVLYSFTSATGKMFITKNGINGIVSNQKKETESLKTTNNEPSCLETHSFAIVFEGSKGYSGVQEKGGDHNPTYNYYVGDKRIQGAASFSEVTLEDVYPGVNLRLYSTPETGLEFDWILKPGASPSQITMRFEGQDAMQLMDKNQTAQIDLRFAELQLQIPESYFILPDGSKEKVEVDFVDYGNNSLSYQLREAAHMPEATLVIDPVLKWGTYYNPPPSFDQYVFATEYDAASGRLYVAGRSDEDLNLTYTPAGSNGYRNNLSGNGGIGGIVYAIDSTGSNIDYITLIGGVNLTNLMGLSLSNNNVFVCGLTNWGNYPVTKTGSNIAFDTTSGTGSGIVSVFDKTLGTLIYSTFLGDGYPYSGGAPYAGVNVIRALSDNSFVVGLTVTDPVPSNYISAGAANSTPITSGSPPSSGVTDAYVAKFSSFNNLDFGTYVFASSGRDVLTDLELLSDGTYAFTGHTDDGTGVTQVNGSIPDGTGTEGVIGVLNANGTAFTYLDVMGGSGLDQINGLSVVPTPGSSVERLYFTGETESSDFPVGTGKRFQKNYRANGDAIVGRVAKDGTDYRATFLGGNRRDLGNCLVAVNVDSAVYVMIFGTTQSNNNFPTQNVAPSSTFFQATKPGTGSQFDRDIFFTILGLDLVQLYFSTYAGGINDDYLGSTGVPFGSNQMSTSDDLRTVYVATTVHARTDIGNINPKMTGNAQGTAFDSVKTTSDDTHIIMALDVSDVFDFVASTVAVDDDNVTLVDSPVSGNVLTNDYDLEGDDNVFETFLNQNGSGTSINSGSTVSGTDTAGNPIANAGTLTFNNDGTYTFTPSTGFVGEIQVPYSKCDDNSFQSCDTALLTITVTPGLDPAINSIIANPDENISYGSPVGGDVNSNDSDPEGHPKDFKSFLNQNGSGSTISTGATVSGVDADGNPVANAGTLAFDGDGNYTFTPASGFKGEVIVPYSICDNQTNPYEACDTSTLTISVLDTISGPPTFNLPPFAGDDFASTTTNTPVTANWLEGDNDPNGDDITLTNIRGTLIDPDNPSTSTTGIVTLTTKQGGTVEMREDGTFTYTPPTGYAGPDQVVYYICDTTTLPPQPLCDSATIYLLVVGPAVPLYVSLQNFEGRWQDNDAVLYWTTVAEHHNKEFVLERSLEDVSDFTPIGNIKSKAPGGNSNALIDYTFTDRNVKKNGAQLYFYRLKNIDFSGKVKYSKVILLNRPFDPQIENIIYPNPAKDKLYVESTVDDLENTSIRIYDNMGKRISVEVTKISKSIIQIDVSKLAAGIYNLVMNEGSYGVKSTSFVIQKE